jgi:hypothetical protein
MFSHPTFTFYKTLAGCVSARGQNEQGQREKETLVLLLLEMALCVDVGRKGTETASRAHTHMQVNIIMFTK